MKKITLVLSILCGGCYSTEHFHENRNCEVTSVVYNSNGSRKVKFLGLKKTYTIFTSDSIKVGSVVSINVISN